jgi:nicotinamide mononucleotide transporter
LLWHSQLYPTAILYVVYGALVIWGFVVWLRASRAERDPALEEVLA